MQTTIYSRIFDLPMAELGLLFKPVQLRVIEKMSRKTELTQNEKRYLRGRLGKKVRLLERLAGFGHPRKDALSMVLDQLGDYYIAGYEALKHNGFGWYFEPRKTEVMNTRIEGTLVMNGKPVIFRRLKTIDRDWWTVDSETGKRYATNPRILVDAKRFGQGHLIRTWTSMLERYGKIFVPDPKKYQNILSAVKDHGRTEDYGV
jgi:hypothetical protein